MRKHLRLALLSLFALPLLNSCATLNELTEPPRAKYVFDPDAGGFQCGFAGKPCEGTEGGFVPYDKAPPLLCTP